MKFGEKLLNMYYSVFRAETSAYDSPRNTIRVLEEQTLKMAKTYRKIVATYA